MDSDLADERISESVNEITPSDLLTCDLLLPRLMNGESDLLTCDLLLPRLMNGEIQYKP